MDIRKSVFYVNAGWQLFNGMAHMFHGPELFRPVVSASPSSAGTLPVGFVGAMQGNYYSAGAWLILSSLLHYHWAQQPRKEPSKGGKRPDNQVLPASWTNLVTEATVATRFMVPVFTALAVYYYKEGEPGAWIFVTATTLFETACAILV